MPLLTFWVCLFFTQVYRAEIAPLKENVNNVNDLAHQFTSSEIQLSPYTLNRLEDLNGRWKLLQVILYNITLTLKMTVLGKKMVLQ